MGSPDSPLTLKKHWRQVSPQKGRHASLPTYLPTWLAASGNPFAGAYCFWVTDGRCLLIGQLCKELPS